MSDDATTMSIGEATAALTGPGQMFEMKDIEIDGVALRAWKNAPASLRVVLDLSLAAVTATFWSTRTSGPPSGSTTGSPRPSPTASGTSTASRRVIGWPLRCATFPSG